MPFYKITFTPQVVLKNPPGLLRAIRRPLAISILGRCSLTSWRSGKREIRAFSCSRIVMSDADYAAFLKKSQKDYSQPSEGVPAAATSTMATSEAHPAIKALGERYYTSEADEPFEGISYDWEKETLPDEDEFGELIGAQGTKITRLVPSKWDVHGKYKDVLDAVTKASGGGAVKVYRVERSASRVEYFVIGVDNSEGKVVGVKVLAIES